MPTRPKESFEPKPRYWIWPVGSLGGRNSIFITVGFRWHFPREGFFFLANILTWRPGNWNLFPTFCHLEFFIVKRKWWMSMSDRYRKQKGQKWLITSVGSVIWLRFVYATLGCKYIKPNLLFRFLNHKPCPIPSLGVPAKYKLVSVSIGLFELSQSWPHTQEQSLTQPMWS